MHRERRAEDALSPAKHAASRAAVVTARRERRKEPRVTVLHPVPAWLSELAGVDVGRAAAWSSGATVWVRASANAADAMVFELSTSSDGLTCARLEPRAGGRPVRAPAARFDRMAADRREQVRRFVGRLLWLDAGGHGDVAGPGYDPSPREQRWLRLSAQLEDLRRVGDASRVAWTDEHAADAGLRDVAVLFDLLEGRWGRVFERADDPDAAPIEWLDPVLRALSGDWAALRAQAAATIDGGGGGPLANVTGMAFELAAFHDAALAAHHRGADAVFGIERAEICLELSKLHRARGDEDDAVLWARRALLTRAPTDHLVGRACDELVRSGAFDDAHAVLEERCAREPFAPDLALSRIELLLRASRCGEARALLERTAESSADPLRVRRCAAVLSALEGRWDEAEAAFSALAEELPGDVAVGAWLCESHLRRGDPEGAEEWLARSRAQAQNAIHLVLRAAQRREPLEADAHILALLEALGEPSDRWHGFAEEGRRDAALELLTRFGGSRSDPLTWRRTRDDGGLGLEVVRLPRESSLLSSRRASAATLKELGVVATDEVERRFDALCRRYPDSPHPLCYWGELSLWLGRYERATALFDEALARRPARWAYVGKAAAHVLRGEWDAADAELAACHRSFNPVIGATTHVYVGEAHRRRGQHAEAREHLELAVRVKPGRVGAWMNLALAHLGLGAADEAERIFDMLEGRFPRLYWDAWHALSGERTWPVPRSRVAELFETALAMMRGNRSSHLITYFDGDGVFRRVPAADRWVEPLARHAPFVAMDLRRRLAVGDAVG